MHLTMLQSLPGSPKTLRSRTKRLVGTAFFCASLLLAAATPASPQAEVNQWIWMGGSYTQNQGGVYGTLGTPAPGNVPGARTGASTWTDSSGNLWLFGGDSVDDDGEFSDDLLEFDPSTDEWTWVAGSHAFDPSTCGGSGCGQPGVYGTLGTPAAGNNPGGRGGASSWTDSNGKLWLFGGFGLDSSGVATNDLNDLWEFDPSTDEWTWMGGSSTGGQPGVYGTLGTPAAGDTPGARDSASSWTDSSGNFWLFGGNGYDGAGAYGYLNDLWEFNPSTKQWTWISGSNTLPLEGVNGLPGVYGTLGSPAAGNVPGSRFTATSWTDSSDHLWLFGGMGFDANGTDGYLNDLWMFNPSTSEWTWMGGSSTVPCQHCAQPGVYGTLGTFAARNAPGGRSSASGWTDGSGNFWLFGGYFEEAQDGSNVSLNDLWEFNPSVNQWKWMSGSSTGNQPGVYGTLGTPAAGNTPGGRDSASSWTDKNGNLWLFGGSGYGGNFFGYLNDLWEYQQSKATPVITLTPSADPAGYGTPVELAAQVTGSEAPPMGTVRFMQGPIELGAAPLNNAGVATISISGLAVGQYSIKATYTGNANYTFATSAGIDLVVPKGTQTISFPSIGPRVTYGVAPIALPATASSGLPITYGVTGPASVSGSTLTVLGAGAVAITAFQPGNADYNPAKPIEQTIVVERAPLKVTAQNATRPVGTANPVFAYTITGFVNGDPSSVVSGAPVLSTTTTPSSPAGEYPITVAQGTLAAGNYYFAPVFGTLTVTP